MDFTRAQQILNSEETFQVMFDGSPVWIESLNLKNQTAKVRPLNGQGNIQEVSITQLVES